VARGAVRGDAELAVLVDRLARAGTRIVHPELDRPVVDGGVRMTALAPRYRSAVAEVDPVVSVNDNSLVVRIDWAGRSLLFTGDVEEEGELALVDRYGGAIASDVVKVAHHGSPTSSTPRFVRATSPRLAVISCGVANRFGFPSAAVEARWRAAGAVVRRTDRAGAIAVRLSREGEMTVTSFDPPAAPGGREGP
jgi:competence protein ComEC